MTTTVDPFAQALQRTTSHQTLFSRREYTIIGVLALIVFATPLFVATATNHPMTTLSGSQSSIRGYLQATSAPTFGDEESLARHFMSQAQALLSSSPSPVAAQEARLLLDQADQQLALIPETTSKTSPLREQIARLEQQQGQAIIAAPTVESTAVTQSTVGSNTTSGESTFPKGATTLWVPHPGLVGGSQIYITPQGTTHNAVIYVGRKVAGKGFELTSTTPVAEDIALTWYEIL